MSKATATQTVLTKTTSSKCLDLDARLQAEMFAGNPRLEKARMSYPQLTWLNDAKHAGLFIKDSELLKAQWFGLTHNGATVKHQFRDTNKTVSEGLLFTNPNLVIVDQSPTFIERKEKADPNVKNSKDKTVIVDILADKEGKWIEGKYEWFNEQRALGDPLQMTTFYLVFLYNDGRERLHKIPFVLKTKSVANAVFGKALKEFEMLASNDLMQERSNAKQLTIASRATYIFQPVLVDQPVGDYGSICCVIPQLTDNTYDFKYRRVTDDPEQLRLLEEELEEVRQSNSSFTERYIEDNSEHHALAAGIETEIKALPANLMTVDAEFDVSA